MRAFVTDRAGVCWTLPVLTRWRMEYALGTPCDSFSLQCPWEAGSGAEPSRWVGFYAEEQGERVFTGVVDESTVAQSEAGGFLELTGRGMAARLLDNEALPQDYGVATQADLLRDHVTPYGISAVGGELPPVAGFSVAAGSSEWSVVYEFARYHGGVTPRFDRLGRLVLSGWEDSQEKLLGDAAPVTALVCRDKRYGVLSEVLVRDRYSGAVQRVENDRFRQDGGMARRVITSPGRSSYKTMRYTGRFQLDRAAGERLRVEATVAQPFCAWPGELVRVSRSGWERNGLFRVVASTVGLDRSGLWTRLELAEPDVVL